MNAPILPKLRVKVSKPLSKSRFLSGLQCEKRLWFETHAKAVGPSAPDPEADYILQQGTAVGILARNLFPGGRLITASFMEPQWAVVETQKAIAEGALTLFEAGAEGGGAFARADILVRRSLKGPWDIYEVKTSGYRDEDELAEAKDPFLWDLAVQRFAFEEAGFKIGKTSLVLINSEFVRQGSVDPKKFFKIVDVSNEVSKRRVDVPARLKALTKVLSLAKAPPKPIGAHCSTPYPCPFMDACWPTESADHVFKLRGMRWDKKLSHFHAGRTQFKQLLGEKLTDWQTTQIAVQKSGRVWMDKPKLKSFLNGLVYPIYHLDFETVNPAVPPFDGVRPFRQTVFQYSLHIQSKLGAKPQHHEFLPTDRHDPRPALIAALLDQLGTTGTLLAYNAPFETGRLKELAERFPKQRKRIEAVLGRFQDLMTPFAKGWFVHPDFEGSTSIKAVLPALVPTMTYKGMPVGDGAGAIRAYGEFLRPETNLARQRDIRKDLLAYCGQDTLAMVKILDVLWAAVS